MRDRSMHRAWAVVAAGCLSAVIAVGCSAGVGATTSPSNRGESTAAPSTAPPPASPSPARTTPLAPSPSTASTTRFASVLYPYALTMPAGSLTRSWHAATSAWNETQRFDLLGPALDRSGVADGSLLFIGGPAPDGLKAFSDLGVEKANVHHACTPLGAEGTVTIQNVPAIVLSQSCEGQVLVRATMVRKDQGLIAFLWLNVGHEAEAVDHLVGWLEGGLEWTAP
jgi:hypothetical protein